MKIRNLALAVLAVSLLGGCAKEEVYTPTKGGIVDTLHNEIHVPSLEDLQKGGFDKEKDVSKIYITDDDGFKYIYDVETEQYVLAQETDTTINFYFDANQTTRIVGDEQIDAPIYVAEWFMIKPLGACPEEVNTEAKVLEIGRMFGFEPKQGFDHFVGFSMYSSCLGDEEHLWNFEKDFKQQAVTNLYGIWVDE
ncbi:MAG: hypothetical protein IKP50_05140 [Bacilli bacterium]|nr:hypothetical protein [Bacilli bacterium]